MPFLPSKSSTRPREGLRPKRPQWLAGMRIEPPPSVAWAAGTTPAATAAAEPPDEPPVERLRSQGLCVRPVATGSVLGRKPASGVADLPSTIRPARSKASQLGACSVAGGARRCDCDPPRVGRPL